MISASISAHGVVEKHKGIVIRVVVIIASCPLPDVGHPLYSGSDSDGYRSSRRCLRSSQHHQLRQFIKRRRALLPLD
jgi:hypothetical protein